MDRGVDGPLLPRPLVSFSLERWEVGGVRMEVLSGEGAEEEEEEEVSRRCDAESARLRQGIFSRLTTGSDTLQKSKIRVKVQQHTAFNQILTALKILSGCEY